MSFTNTKAVRQEGSWVGHDCSIVTFDGGAQRRRSIKDTTSIKSGRKAISISRGAQWRSGGTNK